MVSILEQLRERTVILEAMDLATKKRERLRAGRSARIVGKLRHEIARPTKERPSIVERLKNRIESLEESGGLNELDIDRICALPVIPILTENEIAEINERYVQAAEFDRGFRLKEPQCRAILQYELYKGLLGPIGVGKGKTLISLKIVDLAYRNGAKKIMLMVPASVYGQLTMNDIQSSRLRVSLVVPFHGLGGRTAKDRLGLARSGRKGCYILPYSCLSTVDSIQLLNAIRPDCIVLDEAHFVKHAHAARTKRLRRYLKWRNPELIALSGTLTNKSIRDYHYISSAALGPNSPLPSSPIIANEWATVLDSDAEFSGAATGPLDDLVQWARRSFPKTDIPYGITGFRSAYRLRLTTCPGVVATSNEDIGTSLTITTRPIKNHESSEGWPRLKSLLDKVIDEAQTPTGDEIDHAIHTFKWLYELSAGFYNELTWPAPDALAHRQVCSFRRAEKQLEDAREHHLVSQEYARQLRSWLRYKSKPGLDTPMTVGKSMSRDGDKEVTAELYDVWVAKKALEQEFKLRFSAEKVLIRDSNPVRVCSYKIDHLLRWARTRKPEKKGCLVWVYHQEMGIWAYEALKAEGYDVLYCPAGDVGNREILDKDNKRKVIVASMSAHGSCKNLQHFEHQYFLQWPRSASLAEQVLGRTHREGQLADELCPYLNTTIEFDVLNFAACLNDALYVTQSLGNEQKLIFCGYDPLPAIFPSAVLRERGFQPKQLTVDQERHLTQKFAADQTARKTK